MYVHNMYIYIYMIESNHSLRTTQIHGFPKFCQWLLRQCQNASSCINHKNSAATVSAVLAACSRCLLKIELKWNPIAGPSWHNYFRISFFFILHVLTSKIIDF